MATAPTRMCATRTVCQTTAWKASGLQRRSSTTISCRYCDTDTHCTPEPEPHMSALRACVRASNSRQTMTSPWNGTRSTLRPIRCPSSRQHEAIVDECFNTLYDPKESTSNNIGDTWLGYAMSSMFSNCSSDICTTTEFQCPRLATRVALTALERRG